MSAILVYWTSKRVEIKNLYPQTLVIRIQKHFFSSQNYVFPKDIPENDKDLIKKIIAIGKRMSLSISKEELARKIHVKKSNANRFRLTYYFS